VYCPEEKMVTESEFLSHPVGMRAETETPRSQTALSPAKVGRPSLTQISAEPKIIRFPPAQTLFLSRLMTHESSTDVIGSRQRHYQILSS